MADYLRIAQAALADLKTAASAEWARWPNQPTSTIGGRYLLD